MAKQIQITKRQIPIEQIIAIQGRSPVATGIETAGNVLGQALARKAELQRQGEMLARAEAQDLAKFNREAELKRELQQNALSAREGTNDKKPVKLQFAGLDEAGNPIVFNPDTGNLQTGGRATSSSGALLPKQKKVLPGAVLQDIKNQESAISLLEKAAQTSPEIIERSTGFFGGKVAPALSKVPGVGAPFRDPQRAVFQQNVKTGLLKFLYSEAGKQLSDPERLAVTDAIGSVDQPSEQFTPLLNNAIGIIKGAQQRYQESLGGSGYLMPQSGLPTIERPAPRTITPKKAGRFIIEEE